MSKKHILYHFAKLLKASSVKTLRSRKHLRKKPSQKSMTDLYLFYLFLRT